MAISTRPFTPYETQVCVSDTGILYDPAGIPSPRLPEPQNRVISPLGYGIRTLRRSKFDLAPALLLAGLLGGKKCYKQAKQNNTRWPIIRSVFEGKFLPQQHSENTMAGVGLGPETEFTLGLDGRADIDFRSNREPCYPPQLLYVSVVVPVYRQLSRAPAAVSTIGGHSEGGTWRMPSQIPT
ncbi:hypothetical protein TgHK011_001329 [Trichoderma gracile]|nr:hypothetical protein TgHK011_001329 [Trichoderma gracile]